MLSSLPASKWNFTTAAHLLNRAGFGGSPAEIEKLEKMGLESAVGSLVDYETITDDTANPAWAKTDPDQIKQRPQMREGKQKKRTATEQERGAPEQKTREINREKQQEKG